MSLIRMPRPSRSLRTATKWLTVVALVAVSAGAVVEGMYPGPQQPIPFSHYIHVTTKKLNCFFCHQYAATSSNPGMPPTEKCLLCHSVIATNFRPIRKITTYYERGEPIPWVRVYQLPDFVQFSHQPHIAKGFDCSVCHGNVKGMNRIREAYVINMNFCVSCHWKNKASSNCFVCHY
jgi:hypothetical protein